MHATGYLMHAVLLFGAALVIAWLFRILRAPAAIGFLFAGLVIGPSGLKLITVESVEQFAELGLVMLLFTVGLELSPEPLMRSGKRLIIAAFLQIILTAIVAFVGFRLFRPVGVSATIIVSIAVALSSTAIVLTQLAERGQAGTSGGLIITGILLLQDVFVILLMLFLPLFAEAEGSDWKSATTKGLISAAGLIAATIVAKRLVPLFLKAIVRWGGRELFTLFAVVAALTGAWLAGLAGWSWALGSCIVGLILSQTDMRHQLCAEIMPFRDVLNALFFISMGMLVDVPCVIIDLPFIAFAVVMTLIGKSLVGAISVRLCGWPTRLAVLSGIGLCTVSEFGYVFAREADRLNILPDRAFDKFTAYIVGTMMVGAVLFPFAGRISLLVAHLLGSDTRPEADESAGAGLGLSSHVIIVGYGLNGQNLARVLTATKIHFCVVEMNQRLAHLARQAGHHVVVGDSARMAILAHAGFERARALVVAINDQEATRRIIAQVRAAREDLYILARTRYTSELDVLYRLGAHQVIPEEFETSIEIFSHVLKHFGIPENIIDAQITMIRAGNYGMLRGRSSTSADRADLMSLLQATTTQTYMVAEDSPACGKTIRELDLRARTGVTIIAVVRRGAATTNPPSDYFFESGDVLVLLGGHKQLDEAKSMLSSSHPPIMGASIA